MIACRCRRPGLKLIKSPLTGAFINWLRGLDLNQRPSGYEPDELPDCSTPRQTGHELYDHTDNRSTERLKQESPHLRACLFGTEEGTRTPTAYGHYHLKVACLPIPPPRQKPVSLLLFDLRYFVCTRRGRSRLQDRNILDCRLANWHFQHCRIRQARLRNLLGLTRREEPQTQAGQEKNASKYSSKPTKKGSRTLASEYGCRSSRTE